METSYWTDIRSMVAYYPAVGFEQAYFSGWDAIGYGCEGGPCRSLPHANFDIDNGVVLIALIDKDLKITELIDKNDLQAGQPHAEFSMEIVGLRRWWIEPKPL